jgi:beta-lactamase regulating signal transducer with metallopeptidase domain
MTTWVGPLCTGLIGIYAVSSIVLVATAILFRLIRQPARRLAVAEASLLGLVGFCLVSLTATWTAHPADSRDEGAPEASAPQVGHVHAVDDGSVAADSARWLGQCTPPKRRTCEATPSTSTAMTVPPQGPVPPGSARKPGLSWPLVLAGLWSVGAVGAVAWLIAGWLATQRLLRCGQNQTAQLQALLDRVVGGGRLPRLVVTPAPVQPMAVGSFWPTIVLPEAFVRAESADSLEAALAHEWAHIRRGDLRLLFLARILLPVFCLHPAFLWLRARIRTDLEAVADSWAARGRPLEYAEMLLRWARSNHPRHRTHLAGALGLWGSGSSLRQRIETLTAPGSSIEPETPGIWQGVCRASAIAVIVAVVPFRGVGGSIDPRSTTSLEERTVDCSCAPPPSVASMLCPTDTPNDRLEIDPTIRGEKSFDP